MSTLQIIHTESNLCLTFTHQLFLSNYTNTSYQFFLFEEISSTFLEANLPKLKKVTDEFLFTPSITLQLHCIITSLLPQNQCLSLDENKTLILQRFKDESRNPFPKQNFVYADGCLRLRKIKQCLSPLSIHQCNCSLTK